MNKILWFDTETTGLDPRRHAMIKIAYIIDIDGVIAESGVLNVKPFKGDLLNEEALNICGITKDEISYYPEPKEIHSMLVEIFSLFIDKYDKTDHFIPGGFNVSFDIDFISSFFEKNGDKYLGSFIDRRRPLDPRYLLSFLDYSGKIKLPSYKLADVAKHLNIELDNHNPVSDIFATRQIFYMLKNIYFKNGEDLK